ncbi:hypothetical protein [Paenibacillus sp. NPDC057967]|uniref:hypothetical protein n=1 Tax=Paenibacillus sp. NPDC057967 TaxID=3346293 RepID=UPI0036D9A767
MNGGNIYPAISNSYTIVFRPGLTIGGALAESGVIAFAADGTIVTISGYPISGNIGYQLRLNGRIIPAASIHLPIQPSDTVTVDIVYR